MAGRSGVSREWHETYWTYGWNRGQTGLCRTGPESRTRTRREAATVLVPSRVINMPPGHRLCYIGREGGEGQWKREKEKESKEDVKRFRCIAFCSVWQQESPDKCSVIRKTLEGLSNCTAAPYCLAIGRLLQLCSPYPSVFQYRP